MGNISKIQIGRQTYLVTSEIYKLTEGAAILYNNSISGYASFIDNENRTCTIHYAGNAFEVSFDQLSVVLESTNPYDGTPNIK